MLQSAFRPISNYLTTNWPILWAARLDVALACGLLFLFLGIPIFWLGHAPLRELKWGPYDLTGIGSIITVLMILGAIIVWVISVGRVYVRGMSPRMFQYPRFIDILLGSIMITTPTVIVGIFAVFDVKEADLNMLGPPALAMGFFSVGLSTSLAFILIAILRSSMTMALLSLICVAMAVGFVQWTITIAVTRWSVARGGLDSLNYAAFMTTSATVELFTAMSMIAFLVWVLSGTTRLHIRQRLATILFPALVFAVRTIHDAAIQLLGLAVLTDKGDIDYMATYANPKVAFVFAPLFLIITVILGEVLSRRWARLTLLPK
jgi:hypothetical protein